MSKYWLLALRAASLGTELECHLEAVASAGEVRRDVIKTFGCTAGEGLGKSQRSEAGTRKTLQERFDVTVFSRLWYCKGCS